MPKLLSYEAVVGRILPSPDLMSWSTERLRRAIDGYRDAGFPRQAQALSNVLRKKMAENYKRTGDFNLEEF